MKSNQEPGSDVEEKTTELQEAAKRTAAPCYVSTVLDRLKAFAQKDAANYAEICKSLDAMLDDLAADDFFGTECQLDPRGDGREGDWSLSAQRIQT